MIYRALVAIAISLFPAHILAATYTSISGNQFGIYVDSTDGEATIMLICQPLLVQIEPEAEATMLTVERLGLRVNSDSTFGEGRKGSAYFGIAGSGDSFGNSLSEFDWSSAAKRFHADMGMPFSRHVDIDSVSVWKAIESNERVTAQLKLADPSIEDILDRSRSLSFSFDLSDFHQKIHANREQCRSGGDRGMTPTRLY